jgi:nucleotidyltransferase AbiEii toxin of type IV toxin-antitoxin system
VVSILTKTQHAFLRAFFANAENDERFYLSGGTALAGFYLFHRYSDDIDIFTREERCLLEGDFGGPLDLALRATALTTEDVPRPGYYMRYRLSGDPHPEHPLTKVELILDTPPYCAHPRWIDGVRVDDVLSIAVNKVTALGRLEPRDYVDLYLLVERGLASMDDLLRLAPDKDPGLQPLVIADTFDQVESLTGVARYLERYMIAPLDWRRVLTFYADWAERIRDLNPPL